MQPLSPADLGIIARTRWASNSISYSFYANSPPVYWTDQDLLPLFGSVGAQTSALTARQVTAFQAAVDAWSAVADITLQQTTTGVGDIFVGRTVFNSGVGPNAQAATLRLGSHVDRQGDIWLSTRAGMNDSEMDAGEVGFFSILHELGHALGLQGDNFLAGYSWNSLRYTVMSYRDLGGNQIDIGTTKRFPSMPMLLDIAAIQRLYGANPNTNAGNDVYTFQTLQNWPIQAIWDAGGTDLIDGSGESRDRYIDLNPGGESRADSRFSQDEEIHIAFTPTDQQGNLVQRYIDNFIENANGGSGEDTLIGNAGVNCRARDRPHRRRQYPDGNRRRRYVLRR